MSPATYQTPLRARHRVGSPNHTRLVDRGAYVSCVVSPRHSGGKLRHQTQLENQKPARRFHRNQQYSITALTDGGGSIAERYAYTAYGQVTFANASGTVQSTSASNNRYAYTGREWDQGLSLYHYRARMYDAESGRFVSRDPIGYYDGSNLHEFLKSRTLDGTDSTGLFYESRTRLQCYFKSSKTFNFYPRSCGMLCSYVCFSMIQFRLRERDWESAWKLHRPQPAGVFIGPFPPVQGVPKNELIRLDPKYCDPCSTNTEEPICPTIEPSDPTNWQPSLPPDPQFYV